MNNNLKHAGLSWEEAIRLNAVTEEHVLHMQNIIINQEGIIEDLETRIQDTERLLDSLEVEELLTLLDDVWSNESKNQTAIAKIEILLVNLRERKDNE